MVGLYPVVKLISQVMLSGLVSKRLKTVFIVNVRIVLNKRENREMDFNNTSYTVKDFLIVVFIMSASLLAFIMLLIYYRGVLI